MRPCRPNWCSQTATGRAAVLERQRTAARDVEGLGVGGIVDDARSVDDHRVVDVDRVGLRVRRAGEEDFADRDDAVVVRHRRDAGIGKRGGAARDGGGSPVVGFDPLVAPLPPTHVAFCACAATTPSPVVTSSTASECRAIARHSAGCLRSQFPDRPCRPSDCIEPKNSIQAYVGWPENAPSEGLSTPSFPISR